MNNSKESSSPNHIQILMDINYVKKLHDGALKQAVNDMVQARRRNGKLEKNAYMAIIDVLSECGIKISRDALYKRVEREIRNLIPMEVSVNGTNSDLSTFTQQESNVSSLISSGRPKGSTSNKKRKDKITYDNCIKSICEDYAAQLDANRTFKRHCKRNFLSSLIEEKKQNIMLRTISQPKPFE